jgi:hypothetical protein
MDLGNPMNDAPLITGPVFPFVSTNDVSLPGESVQSHARRQMKEVIQSINLI